MDRVVPMGLSDRLRDAGSDFISIPPDELSQPVKRFTYMKEPYVRAIIPLRAGGSITVDGKVTFWTPAEVMVRWEDDGRAHNVWVTADSVQRISRKESAWTDVYDDLSQY